RLEPVVGGEEGLDRAAEGLLDRARDVLEPTKARRRSGGRAAQGDDAEADRFDLARGEIVEPRPVEARPAFRVALRGRAAVAQPRLGVLGRVEALALNHPAVEAGRREPRLDRIAPRLPLPHL